MNAAQLPGRNNYIDCLRGIAAISIVFIHTCFWSGESYVPEFMQSLSLAIDVPFFFFLSGWASTYVNSFEKNIVSLLGTYKKYVMFFPFYMMALLVVGVFSGRFTGLTLSNLYANLFFIRIENSTLPVVMSSMWFMPVYLTVVPIGCVVTKKLLSRDTPLGGGGVTCLLVTGLGLLYSYWTGSFFCLNSVTLFYLLFYFLGIACRDVCIKRLKTVIIFSLADVGLMKLIGVYFGWDVSNMQGMKFPPNIIYLLYSLLWICVVLWGKSKLWEISADNVLCKIGRSAILFYFCQGISSSLLSFIVPKITMGWGIKLPIAFVINLTGTVILVIMLDWFFRFEKCLAAKLRDTVSGILELHRK